MKTALPRCSSLVIVLVVLLAAACTDRDTAKRRHMEKADAFSAKGEYQQAILEYRSALKLDARFGEARFKLAQAYMAVQNAGQAAVEFARAADLMPERADVQITAGTMMIGRQQFDLAAKYARAGVKADPKSVEALILLANALAGQEDIDGALRELERSMKLAPGDSRPYTSLGTMKTLQGNRQQAEAAYLKAVEIDPTSVAARVALAYFYWGTERLGDAEATFKGALDIDQQDHLANRMLATFYLTQGRPSDAETPLLRLVNAKDTGAAVTLGDVYARTGRADAARRLYESLKADKSSRPLAIARLASLDYAGDKRTEAWKTLDSGLTEAPNSIELLTLKAGWLVRERRFDEALAAAQKAVVSDPKSAAAHAELGRVHAARGSVDEAVQALGDALKLDPNAEGADEQLARVLLVRGEADVALKHARAAQARDPKDPNVRMTVAAALLALKDASRAEADLKALAAEYPAEGRVHLLYGQALLAKGDRAGAAGEFDRALTANPSDNEAMTGRLLAELDRNQAQQGRARLEAAVQKQPDNEGLLLLAARYELATSNSPAAEQYLKKALATSSPDLQTYHMLGQLYVSEKRLDEARAQFEQVLKRQPDSVPARTMVGIILTEQKKEPEAMAVYETVVKTSERAPVAANNLAYLYAERGQQLDVALGLAQSAASQMPGEPDVQDTLGWVYYKKGLLPLAIKSLEFCVQKDPKNPLYQYHVGMAYSKDGQRGKARQALSEALRLNPAFPGAAQALAALGTK